MNNLAAHRVGVNRLFVLVLYLPNKESIHGWEISPAENA
jgi:hypothetical protein